MRRLVLGGLFAMALLPGCVYYNGVYNTKRLTREAEQADREGRRFEAQGLYAQAVVKADSVLARYPGSSWADDARFLRGQALARIQSCDRGVNDLELVTTTSPDTALAMQALEVLGECYLALDRPDDATLAFERRWNAADSAARSRLAAPLASALRQSGRVAEAGPLLEQWGGRIDAADRLAVLGSLGRDAEALALAESLLATGTDPGWVELVQTTAPWNAELTSTLTARLAAHDSIPAALRTRLRIAEGDRLLARDTARASEAYRQALAAAEGSAGTAPARAALVRIALARADTSALAALADSLDAVASLGGPTGPDAARRAASVRRVSEVRDSLARSGAVADADLWAFLVAELVRDSVGAPRAAASLFAQMSIDHEGSAYSAKALLAAAVLDPGGRDSLVALALRRYPASPHVLLLRGDDVPAFAVLEDSLRQWSATAFRRPPDRRRPAQPQNRPPTDDLP